ncbi:MAG TPA: hypothetical protein VK206_20095, partial [Anaerolineales bacterium]|nr:hypothetical protein [Anaerolineales bacterium]
KRRAGHTLTLKGYADAGGVHGAIAHTVESVYQNLSLDEQTIARDIFLRLTELGEGTEDTRRRASFAELMSNVENADEVRQVLNLLAEARLITLGEDTAEVAHEALIREWPTLREWLNQDREGLLLHRHLTEAAYEWELLERDMGALYRGVHLAQAREWAALHPKRLNAGEQAFLDASNELEQHEAKEREAQQQRELEAAQKLAESERQSIVRLRIRNRIISAVGVVALILAVLAGVFALSSNQNAQKAQTNFTHADALRLAAEANKLLLQPGSDADLTALLSIRSMNTEYTPQGDGAVEGATNLAFPVRVFTGHTDDTFGAVFSPDGKYVLTGSLDKTARLWDVQTGKEVRQLIGHSDAVDDVAFSPDGKYVATASWDQTARLWDAQTGKQLQIYNHSIWLSRVAFVPDGKYIITATGDETAHLWNVQTGQPVRTYTQSGRIQDFAISPDGKNLLTGGREKAIHIWDIQTGIELHQFSLPVWTGPVTFSPDGQYILAGGADNIIRLLDRNTGQVVRTFVGHTFQIQRLKYSPDGKYLVSIADDGTARLWDALTGDLIRILTVHPNNHPGEGLAFSPDGKYIFTASRAGLLWDTESVINTGLPQFFTPNDPVNDVAFSPDGKYVATASQSQNLARLWDIQTRQEIREFVGHISYVNRLTFSPDGKYLLTGGGTSDNTARLWSVQTGQELQRFVEPPPENGVDLAGPTVAFSPDGRYIATVSERAFLWDPQTGHQIREFIGHTDIVSSVAFSPDSRYLLTGSSDGTARLWEVQTGKQLQLFKHPEGDQVNWVAFSPDGKHALTGGFDGLIRLWSIETGAELREFSGHTASVWTVAFSLDGKYALSASDDSTARLWDVATGIELRRFIGHTAALWGAVFSPDDKYVLTGSNDGTARIWFTDYHDEIKYLCSRLSRDFTDEERKQYDIKDTKPTCPKP